MAWICSLLEKNLTYKVQRDELESYNISLLNIYGDVSGDNRISTTEMKWDFLDVSNKLLIPCLCFCGLVGNSLNLAILGKRLREGRN